MTTLARYNPRRQLLGRRVKPTCRFLLRDSVLNRYRDEKSLRETAKDLQRTSQRLRLTTSLSCGSYPHMSLAPAARMHRIYIEEHAQECSGVVHNSQLKDL